MDVPGLHQLIAHVAPHVDAILVGEASWGEGAALSRELKRELISEVWKVIDRPIPLLLGITGRDEDEVLSLVQWIEEEKNRVRVGNPLILVDYPLWYRSNRGLPQYLEKLLSHSTLQLLIGNDPFLVEKRRRPIKRKNLQAAVLQQIAGLDKVRGMIYQGTPQRFSQYGQAVSSDSGFRFYDGDEMTFLSSPSRYGVCAPSSNLFPREWCTVVRMALFSSNDEIVFESERSEAWNLYDRLHRFLDLIRPHGVHELKSLLARRGVIKSEFATDLYPKMDSSRMKKIELALGRIPAS